MCAVGDFAAPEAVGSEVRGAANLGSQPLSADGRHPYQPGCLLL